MLVRLGRLARVLVPARTALGLGPSLYFVDRLAGRLSCAVFNRPAGRLVGRRAVFPVPARAALRSVAKAPSATLFFDPRLAGRSCRAAGRAAGRRRVVVPYFLSFGERK